MKILLIPPSDVYLHLIVLISLVLFITMAMIKITTLTKTR